MKSCCAAGCDPHLVFFDSHTRRCSSRVISWCMVYWHGEPCEPQQACLCTCAFSITTSRKFGSTRIRRSMQCRRLRRSNRKVCCNAKVHGHGSDSSICTSPSGVKCAQERNEIGALRVIRFPALEDCSTIHIDIVGTCRRCTRKCSECSDHGWRSRPGVTMQRMQ